MDGCAGAAHGSGHHAVAFAFPTRRYVGNLSAAGSYHVWHGTDAEGGGFPRGTDTPQGCTDGLSGAVHYHASVGMGAHESVPAACRTGHWRDTGGMLPRRYCLQRDYFLGKGRLSAFSGHDGSLYRFGAPTHSPTHFAAGR